jgi:hypothetical protein
MKFTGSEVFGKPIPKHYFGDIVHDLYGNCAN